MISSTAKDMFRPHDFKRKYERKKYDAYIVFAFKGQMFQGYLKDISIGGAFIESSQTYHLAEGDRVTISVPFTDGLKHVKRSGRVLWKNSTGFAITFDY